MRTILCLAALLLSAAPGLASGGIWCSADDAAVKFEVDAGVTRGMGGPTFNFKGDLTVHDEAVNQELSKTVFDDSNLAQYWLDGKELRLLVYREHEVGQSYVSAELTILTKASDEGVYEGTYALALHDGTVETTEYKTTDFTGKVSCGAE